MARIRSTGNKDTELKLASIFRSYGIKGWRRKYLLLGRPDFVFAKHRVAIFVDGCFWHGCPKHGRKPESNCDYWSKKLQRNYKREKTVNKTLRAAGWFVIRLWEHDLAKAENCAAKIRRALIALESV